MDASSYINGASLSRRETTALKRDIDTARTPLENFAREHDRLGEALRKGAIDIGTYNRLLDAKREKYGMTTTAATSYSAILGPLSVGIGAVTAASTAAVAAGVAFVNHLKETQNEIDAVADAAGKLGVEYNALIGIRFAAQEAGGVEASAVDAGIKKMQIALSKGSAAFAQLGLDVSQLKSAGAVEAFSQIADKFSQISDHSDKLRIATEIFGKGGTELVSTLSNGRDAIDESVGFMVRLGGLTDAQVLAVQDSNDAWDRVGIAVEGISTKLAAEAAPAFLLVAEYALGTVESVEDIDQLLRGTVETVIGLAGWMKDLAEINPLGLLDGSAMDMSSAETMLSALYAKRAELESQAIRDKFDKEGTLQLELEDTAAKRVADREWESMMDRVLKEEQMRIDAENKHAQTALANAEKHLNKERENARKLRDDIAKGPMSMEAGSAEAAKFMADQANAAIAASVSPDAGPPTEQEILIEAIKQSELLAKSEANETKQVELLQKLLEKKPEMAKIR